MKKALVDFFIAYGAEEVLEAMRKLLPEARAKLQELNFPSLIKRLAGGEKKPKEKQSKQQDLF